MIKRIILSLSLLVFPLLVFAPNVGAVDIFRDACSSYDGPADQAPAACRENQATKGKNPLFGSNGILTRIISLLSILTAIVAIIIIILAGLKMVTSGTNPQDIDNARERVIYACVALVVAALAQGMVQLILNRIVQ